MLSPAGIYYFMNISLFRGVKPALILPVIYAGVLFFFTKDENGEIEFKGFKTAFLQYMKKRYIVPGIILAVLAAVAFLIYIKRSGNNVIPFKEAYIRNAITDLIYARPRTKEFLLAWPCFTIFLYMAKKFPSGICEWFFASVSGMLFASVINTFCHVFTSVDIMYLRFAYGILAALPFMAVAVAVDYLVINIASKIKR